jgi:uncharacterized cupin superfamily protein
MAIASSWTVAGLPACRPDVKPMHVLTALRKVVLAAVLVAMGATAGFAYGSGGSSAAFEESGKATFTFPVDECLVVTAGTATIAVNGGETIKLKKGDVACLREGTTVDFEFSDDFADVTCLMADHEVKWR